VDEGGTRNWCSTYRQVHTQRQADTKLLRQAGAYTGGQATGRYQGRHVGPCIT